MKASVLALALLMLVPATLTPTPGVDAAATSVLGALSPLPPLCSWMNVNRPQGLTGDAAAYYNGKTYVLGGRLADSNYYDGILEYDHASGTSREVTKLPAVTGSSDLCTNQTSGGRQSAAAVALNDKIYLFGGAVYVGARGLDPNRPTDVTPVPQSIKDIVEFDPATGVARTLPTKLPQAMWGISAATYGNAVYLFGGFSFDVTDAAHIKRWDTIVKFVPTDLITPIQTLPARLPTGTQDTAALAVGSRIYIFGGLSDNSTASPCGYKYYNKTTSAYETKYLTACASDNVLAFSPSTESMNGQVASLPYRIQFVQGATVGNKAYILGGRLSDNTASQSILEFDPSRTVGERIRVLVATLPTPLYAAGTTTDGNTITMMAGRGTTIDDITAKVTLVDPRPTPPWAPRSATARASGGNVALAWDVPAYDGDSPVTGYNIYRTLQGGSEVLVARTETLTYTDSGTVPGGAYDYRITAVNDKGESATSAHALTISEIVPPDPVSSFVAYPGNTEVALRWTPPANTGGANLTGFRVYRTDVSVPILNLPASAVGGTDRGVQNGASYAYVVKAVNSKGEGAPSPTVRVTPQPVPATPQVEATTSASGVTLRWDAPVETVKSYTILRGTNPAQILAIDQLPGNATSYEDARAEHGRTYYYEVKAANDRGESPPSPYVIVNLVSKPGAPTGLTALSLEGTIRLAWQAPFDAGALDPSVVSYIVTRDGRIIATDLKGTAYEDRGLLANQTHTYTVTTFNGLLSDPSDPAAASAKPVQNRPPIAAIAVLTSVVAANETVSVDASGSSDPDGSVAEYVFDFGDGTPATRTSAPSATHAYARNGTFTVTLFVRDDRGLESRSATATVVVGSDVSDTPNPDSLPPSPTVARPGSTKPAPGAPLSLMLLGAAGVALLASARRHPRR